MRRPAPRSSRHFRPKLSSRRLIFLAAFFLIVVLIFSLIGILLRGHEEITILNESSISTSDLTDQELTRVKKELFHTLKTATNIDANYINVYIRPDSFSRTSDHNTFIIDLDDYRQTYLVDLDPYQVYIRCPDPSVSKYPDSFCVGNANEYDDSISVIFGDDLPLSSETSAGESFEIVRSDIKDGAWNRDLSIWIFACPKSDDLTARVSSAVDEIISSRGGSPEAFTKHYYNMSCRGE